MFVDEHNKQGSPLGIVVDEKKTLSFEERQKIATRLNYSETVFIDDVQRGTIQVFSPIRECPFSMYAALGAGWYIHTILGKDVHSLTSHDETIKLSYAKNQVSVCSKISILPQWNLKEVTSVSEVESLTVQSCAKEKHIVIWAWQDKQHEVVRARTFAADWGIPEDEANGSGAMRLAVKLKQPITVVHGKGSVIYAKQIDDNTCSVSGSCTLDNSAATQMKNIFAASKNIAVVGLSDKSDRPSYVVAQYLQNAGYTIFPINPNISQWNGITSYPSVALIPKSVRVDVVDIFRKPEFVAEIVSEAIARTDVHTIWMQEEVLNNEAKQYAEKNGLSVFENTCIMKAHINLDEN